MDNETLRKQVAEEIQEQFESKLREAKRQKTEAEDEFETAAESWRTERRRLKADIDRLESELNDGGRSQNQTPRIQEVPGPKASIEWEAERGRLTSQISRLERAVADAI